MAPFQLKRLCESEFFEEFLIISFLFLNSITFQDTSKFFPHNNTTTSFVENAPDMTSSSFQRDEMYRLRRERDQALKDTQYYRDLLHDKDRDYITLEDELEQARQVCSLRIKTRILNLQLDKIYRRTL